MQTHAHPRDWLWFLPLVLATVLFRVPAILNAQAMSSDATIVGLQAQHILRGEWSRFLWGAGYQSSLDAFIAAAVFALVGASQWTLMLVPLIGHILLVALVFGMLRRHLGAPTAFVLCLALAFTPRAINSVTVYPPRQWSITTMFAAVWFIDRATYARRAPLWLAAGAFLSVMSLYLDLFSLQMMVGVGVFGLLCCWESSNATTTAGLRQRPIQSTLSREIVTLSRGEDSFSRSERSLTAVQDDGFHDYDGTLTTSSTRREFRRRILGYISGFILGFGAFWLLRQGPESTAHTASLTMDKLGPNLRLLWETCLPWLLGVKVFVERGVVWQPPAFFQVVQIVGALSVVAGIVAGGMTFFVRSLPWSLRRLGMLGALIAVSSLGGFAFSAMPADQYSSRYLAPIIWALPFALVPVCWLLGRKRFAAAFMPYLVAAAVSGWLSFGPFVEGITPVLAPRGAARGEAAVRALLVERGVQYAAADYWFAYRLTFMWNEQIIVVPLEAWQDRYPPYRAAFDTAPTVAYIFHPSQPHADAEAAAADLQRGGIRFERVTVDDFTVLVASRTTEN